MSKILVSASTATYVDDIGNVEVITITAAQRETLMKLLAKGNLTYETLQSSLQISKQVSLDTITSNKHFVVDGTSVYHRKVPNVSIPELLLSKMYPKPSKSLLNFWKLAALNPNAESRDGLFWFLETHNFEITKEGYFVAYRNAVATDVDGVYTDQYSNSTTIVMGQPVKMDRAECDHDQNNSCSRGLTTV